MDDLTGACADLAALFPRLADALTRDNAPADSRSVLSASGVVNADVLHAMLTLAAEIPAARAAACNLLDETWQPRPPRFIEQVAGGGAGCGDLGGEGEHGVQDVGVDDATR